MGSGPGGCLVCRQCGSAAEGGGCDHVDGEDRLTRECGEGEDGEIEREGHVVEMSLRTLAMLE